MINIASQQGDALDTQAEEDRRAAKVAKEMVDHPFGRCDICGLIDAHVEGCLDQDGGGQ